MIRELVNCGVLMLNGDCFTITCDTGTGTCYYEDTTQGGTFEILGLEIASPKTRESYEHLIERVRKESIPSIFGLISTADLFEYYALYESEGITVASMVRLTYGQPGVESVGAVKEIDIHVESELPPVEFGDGDGVFATLYDTVGARDEATLRAYIFRVMVLRGVSRLKALTVSRCVEPFADISTAELAKRISKPRQVVYQIQLCYDPAPTVSHTYANYVSGEGLFKLAGCPK